VAVGAAAWLADHGVRAAPGELPVWEIDNLDHRIVLVAHGGTNGVLICHLLGIPPTPWEWQRFSHGHTGVTRFESFPVGHHHAFTLTGLSNQEHLPPELRTG
jgi:probable phosphoglycerate mutase